MQLVETTGGHPMSHLFPRTNTGVRLLVAFLLSWLGASAAEPPVKVDYSDAQLRDWVQPAYPDAARKAKIEGEVQVEFVVGLDGNTSQWRVTEFSDERFNAAALAAVQRWTFDAAIDDGRPVVSAMTVLIEFRLAQLKQKRVPIAPASEVLFPRGLKQTPAKPKFAPEPDYPEELAERKLPGEVRMEFTVDEEGSVREPRVLWASHPAFVEMALRAAEKTKFEPGRQGPVTKSTTMQYPVSFKNFGAKRADVLKANNLSIVGEAAPDVLPQPLVFFAPVFPFSRLLADESGSAEVEFTVDENGSALEVKVVASSSPDFAAAMHAAAEAWFFQPALNGGARVSVRMHAAYEFVLPSGHVAQLVEKLRPEGTGVASGKGLDSGLKPLWRGFPVYPFALISEQVRGEAEIEFIVDRDGRTRLPRVISADREEFGWAAATAISQWVFARPMRGGELTDVRVQISVTFVPPAQ